MRGDESQEPDIAERRPTGFRRILGRFSEVFSEEQQLSWRLTLFYGEASHSRVLRGEREVGKRGRGKHSLLSQVAAVYTVGGKDAVRRERPRRAGHIFRAMMGRAHRSSHSSFDTRSSSGD